MSAPLTVSIALASTKNFDFIAVAATPRLAREALLAGWRTHCDQHPLADPAYLTDDAINVITGPLGQAWRDYDPLRPQQP